MSSRQHAWDLGDLTAGTSRALQRGASMPLLAFVEWTSPMTFSIYCVAAAGGTALLGFLLRG
ncbi:MAG: hypothetical protein DMG10_26160 [Acidobacteria bacterium]|nr:MAG: hypothetical protein DMG10_26160 [Acidobacteriota bacterium]